MLDSRALNISQHHIQGRRDRRAVPTLQLQPRDTSVPLKGGSAAAVSTVAVVGAEMAPSLYYTLFLCVVPCRVRAYSEAHGLITYALDGRVIDSAKLTELKSMLLQ